MNLFIAIGLLFGMFTSGKCITRLLCYEYKFAPYSGDNAYTSCSKYLREMICPEGIPYCTTWTGHYMYEDTYGQIRNYLYEDRGCVSEDIVSSIPFGDHCKEQSVVDAHVSAVLKSLTMTAYPFLQFTNATICVCNSTDKCTPPTPTGDSHAVGAESVPGSGEAEGSPEASGNLRTCITCKEITSDGNIIYPGETELVSCSDNPGEMICPEGISTCMTGVANIAYRLQSGQNVTFRDEKRACAPEEIISSIPPGDHCVEQSVVDAYFFDNDPTELYVDTEDMVFDRILNATFCVCDSADKCTPPSQANCSKAWANTGGDDRHTKPTNSAVNLESTIGLFIASLIYALLCGLRDMQ